MFRKKPTLCKSCEKKYKRMKSMDSYATSGKWHDEYKKYIELEGEVYCSSCIQIVNKTKKKLCAHCAKLFHIL